jgi:hypothetical protein
MTQLICEFELDLYVQKKSAHCAWMNIREAADVTHTASSDKNWHFLQMKVHFIGDYFVEKSGRTKRSLLKIRKNNRTDCHPQKTGHYH